MAKLSFRNKVIQIINEEGCVLVYPINNKPNPKSVWSALTPRKKMVWDWNDEGGDQIVKLWHIKIELSLSREVIYLKWYSNRAVFMSKEVFIHLLAFLNENPKNLSRSAQTALEHLLMDSPQSTRVLKQNLELVGRDNETRYNKTLRELWDRLLIVAYGETEDSSFPSLNMAATETLFENEWNLAQDISPKKAETFLIQKLGPDNLFLKYAQKIKSSRMTKNL